MLYTFRFQFFFQTKENANEDPNPRQPGGANAWFDSGSGGGGGGGGDDEESWD